MTNEKFKISPRKKWRLFIVSILALLPMAFCIMIMILGGSTDEAEVSIDSTKLLTIFLPIFIGISIIYFILCVMFTKSERFYFEDNKINYFFTFIVKKRVSLPLEKINVVKVKRNLIDLILRTSTVEIGSGSVLTSIKPEIKLCLGKDKAQYVADFLQRYSKCVKENKEFNEEFDLLSDVKEDTLTSDSRTIKMTKLDKLKYILTNPILYAMLIFPAVLFVSPFIIRHFSVTEIPEFNDVVFGTIVSSVAISIISLLSIILYTFIGFYNYTVTRRGDEIIIHYGLINVKTFSVSFDKIHGYTVGQGLLKQIFGFASLRLSAIGIDDTKNNNTSLATYAYPCASTKKIKQIISELFPEFNQEREVIKSTKKSFLHTVIIPNACKILFLLPILIYLAVALSVWVLIIPVLLIVILGGLNSVLTYKYAGLSIEGDYVYAINGGFFKRKTLIKASSVQEISTFAGFIRRSQGLCTYLVIYRGSSIFTNKLLIKNLVEKCDDIKKVC